jgi:hypothetical protein
MIKTTFVLASLALCVLSSSSSLSWADTRSSGLPIPTLCGTLDRAEANDKDVTAEKICFAQRSSAPAELNRPLLTAKLSDGTTQVYAVPPKSSDAANAGAPAELVIERIGTIIKGVYFPKFTADVETYSIIVIRGTDNQTLSVEGEVADKIRFRAVNFEPIAVIQ